MRKPAPKPRPREITIEIVRTRITVRELRPIAKARPRVIETEGQAVGA